MKQTAQMGSMAFLIVSLVMITALLSACGKFDDPNISDEYYLFLENQESGGPISDQVLFTVYKNGTVTCGYAELQKMGECTTPLTKEGKQCYENICYTMIEDTFHAQLAALQAQIEAEAAYFEELQKNASNGSNTSEAE